jgi:hypothetical protein
MLNHKSPLSPVKLALACLTLLPLLVTTGCGGGGGALAADFTYSTDWTNRHRTVGGQSQRVTLFDLDGRTVASLIINQDTEGVQATAFTNVPAGSYRLFSELFSLRDLSGVRTGTLQTILDITGGTSFVVSVGSDPTQMKVFPQSATLTVQNSRQFYATAYTSSNQATFVADNTVTWEILGGVATVNSSGTVLGTSAGQGSVRARHNPTGAQGAATLTVNPFQTQTGKWTVMVFMNGANDLHTYTTLNMNQMEKVAQNSDVRFVVQWKQSKSAFPSSTFDGTRRYLVKPDQSSAIVSELVQDLGAGVDMGKPETLHDFISWAQTYYPAQRYVLVVWNHGNGWRRSLSDTPAITRAVSYDDETGNAIQTWQLAQALGNRKFDILAWDASLMQMLEVAYEVQDKAEFVVGSEESPPGEGYPYDLIFQQFRDRPNDTTRALTKSFVDGMLAVPAYQNRKITQSVIETSKLPQLANAVDLFAAQLIAHRETIAPEIPNIRAQAQAYSPTAVRFYRDLSDVAQRVEAAFNIPALTNAAAGVRAAVQNAVVWEGHNALSPGSRGVSIDFSPADRFQPSAHEYGLLRFAKDTRWDDWLSVAP